MPFSIKIIIFAPNLEQQQKEHHIKIAIMANTLTDKKYSFLQDYDCLNYTIKDWGDRYFGKKDYLHVAISRKAPRLIEWYTLQDTSNNEGNDIDIVTELALPFFDWNMYNNIVIADEAIYHGTTFERIQSLIEEANPYADNIEAMPVVTTTDALLSDKIFKALAPGVSIISQSEIPYYIDAVISKFSDLGKPYDIEYPLFYIDFKNRITDSQLEAMLKNVAHNEARKYSISEEEIDYYKSVNYNREKNDDVVSFTYVTDYLFRDSGYGLAVPDFSKLRFFKKGNRLCVASMSPYVIPEHYLCLDSNMFVGQLRSIWNEIFNAANKKYRKHDGSALYDEHCTKCLVMAANYLLSFEHFMRLRSSLLDSMQDEVEVQQFNISRNDIQLLFGPHLGGNVKDALEQIITLEKNPSFFNLGHDNVAVIPSAYAPNYNYQIAIDNLREGQNKSVSMMLSSMFSAMHWLVEVESRGLRRDNYGRLNFGESYGSIIERFKKSSLLSSDIIKQKVHRGIDERIDRGTIVPSYVKETRGLYSEWVRLFRSGENEDIYKDQLLRTLLTIVSKCFAVSKTQFVPKASLEYILSVIYLLEHHSNPILLDKRVFDMPLSVSFNNIFKMYEVEAKIDNQNVGIIKFALDTDVLKLDNFGNISISTSSYAQKLNQGCVLDVEMQAKLDRIISFALDYTQAIFGDENDIRELLNFFFYADPALNLVDILRNTKAKLGAMIIEDDAEASKLEDLWNAITALFQRYPDPGLDFPHQKNSNEQLYKYLFSLYEPVYDKVADSEEFNEVYYLDSPFNLWSYYKTTKVYGDYNEDTYDDFMDWVNDRKKSYNGKESCWYKISDSYENILKCSKHEVQELLLELLY